MIVRLLVVAALLPTAAFAQLELFLFDGTNETPVSNSYILTTAAPGDTIQTRFRIRNEGTGPVVVQTITCAGASFQISATPSLPYTLASGAPVDFTVSFAPTAPGAYSANLQVNTISLTLHANVVTAAVLSIGASGTPLASGSTIAFGGELQGSTLTQTFTLSNAGVSTLTVGAVTVSGAGFQGPIGLTAPIQIAAGSSVQFKMAFTPPAAQAYTATLAVDQRSFSLTGLGLAPPLPGAAIAFSPQAATSATQATVSIPLASASQVSGTGTLAMTFASSVPGATDDPAIQFLSGPLRLATVTISPGGAAGLFNGQPGLTFQTGTTAGTITFKLTLSNNTTVTANYTIAPAIISLTASTAEFRTSAIDVNLTGFDNTQSASQLSFTFYDSNGNVLQPGTFRIDETAAFHQYFTTAQAGGAFTLQATFPVTGGTSLVGSVQAQMTNSMGVTQTQRLTF
jgi:hypothetical protein